jgi:multidrug efflux pump subunit AcrA (membrane-fusion protein)
VEPGTPVLRIVAADALRAEGFAPADALDVLQVGAKVQFVIAASDEAGAVAEAAVTQYQGQLAFVSPEVDPVSRQVRIWAELDNANHELRAGQQGRLVLLRSH